MNEATTPSGKAPKLKKHTVNVIGFVVDGVGYGGATLKKPAGTWAVAAILIWVSDGTGVGTAQRKEHAKGEIHFQRYG